MSERTAIFIGAFELILLSATFYFSGMTYFNTNYDRRDVNRDGLVNTTDLSILATEIDEAQQ